MEEGIRGTKYASEFSGVYKFVNPSIALKEAFSFKFAGIILNYAGLAVADGEDIYNDWGDGTKMAADVVTDTAFVVGGIASCTSAGAAIGSVVPVAGTVAGAVVGLAAGIIYSTATDGIRFNGETLQNHCRDALKSGLDWLKKHL